MLDVLMQLFLLNLIEGFMCVFICVNLNRNVAVSKFVLAWGLCTFTVGIYPMLISIPVLLQLIFCAVNAYIISSIFDLKYMECLKRLLILGFVIMLLCEVMTYIVVLNVFNFNAFTLQVDTMQKFIYGLPTRVIELLLIYTFKRTVDIYEKQ